MAEEVLMSEDTRASQLQSREKKKRSACFAAWKFWFYYQWKLRRSENGHKLPQDIVESSAVESNIFHSMNKTSL